MHFAALDTMDSVSRYRKIEEESDAAGGACIQMVNCVFFLRGDHHQNPPARQGPLLISNIFTCYLKYRRRLAPELAPSKKRIPLKMGCHKTKDIAATVTKRKNCSERVAIAAPGDPELEDNWLGCQPF